MSALNAKTEEIVTNYFRMGKYVENKTRPIGIKVNSVWTKRNLLAEYEKLKQESVNPPFRLKESFSITPDFIKAKNRARVLNEEARKDVSQENNECKVSYSARQDGSIFVYKKTENKWTKSEVIKKED